MNRRFFIKLTGLVAITIATLPHVSFSQTTISTEELIGKGNPKLFGEGYKLREEAYLAFKKMQIAKNRSQLS